MCRVGGPGGSRGGSPLARQLVAGKDLVSFNRFRVEGFGGMGVEGFGPGL